MDQSKDIRFAEKKIDSSWKDQIARDREALASNLKNSAKTSPGSSNNTTSKAFMGFLKSLATQALMSLGEIANPMTGQAEVDLATAKEMIDLLTVLRQKTEGNCSADEKMFFDSALPELQLKFTQHA